MIFLEKMGVIRELRSLSILKPNVLQLAAERSQDHLKVWDSCGFHYCDASDAQWNQVQLGLGVPHGETAVQRGVFSSYFLSGQTVFLTFFGWFSH